MANMLNFSLYDKNRPRRGEFDQVKIKYNTLYCISHPFQRRKRKRIIIISINNLIIYFSMKVMNARFRSLS